MSTVEWTFFSNHGHVYLYIALNTQAVVREIAREVGITERTVLGILHDLEEAGFIEKEKVGRSNHYQIVSKKTLRHPLESNVFLRDIVELFKRSKK